MLRGLASTDPTLSSKGVPDAQREQWQKDHAVALKEMKDARQVPQEVYVGSAYVILIFARVAYVLLG